MTLPSSGPLTSNQILAELGRPANSVLNSTDADLIQLAGRSDFTIPDDFYGKSVFPEFRLDQQASYFAGPLQDFWGATNWISPPENWQDAAGDLPLITSPQGRIRGAAGGGNVVELVKGDYLGFAGIKYQENVVLDPPLYALEVGFWLDNKFTQTPIPVTLPNWQLSINFTIQSDQGNSLTINIPQAFGFINEFNSFDGGKPAGSQYNNVNLVFYVAITTATADLYGLTEQQVRDFATYVKGAGLNRAYTITVNDYNSVLVQP